jgi:hypothetical protein
VTQVIGAELRLETIPGFAEGCRHDAGIRDDHIKQAAIGEEPVRSGTHALQVREVELDQLKTCAGFLRGLAYFRGCPLRFLHVTRCAHHVGAMRHQRTSRFYTETRRNPRHQNPFTLEIGACENILCRRLCSKLSCHTVRSCCKRFDLGFAGCGGKGRYGLQPIHKLPNTGRAFRAAEKKTG